MPGSTVQHQFSSAVSSFDILSVSCSGWTRSASVSSDQTQTGLVGCPVAQSVPGFRFTQFGAPLCSWSCA